MRWLPFLILLGGCGLLETDRMRAERECFEAGECWRLANALAVDGQPGEAALRSILTGDLSEDGKRALIADYVLKRPSWAEQPGNFDQVLDAIAWPPRRAWSERLPHDLRLKVVRALDARGVHVALPGPRMDSPKSRRGVVTARSLADWCQAVAPLIQRRLTRGRATAWDVRMLLRYRCDGDGLAQLARTLDRPESAAIRAKVARSVPPGQARRETIWRADPTRNHPLAVVQAFMAPEISCATAVEVVGFADGPYRFHWGVEETHAFTEAVIEWRTRCAPTDDWSQFIEQMPNDVGAAIKAAHSPRSMSCDDVRAALEQMRSWVERRPMPASITALEAAERLQCR